MIDTNTPQQNTLQLERLVIRMNDYGAIKGQYTATVSYKGRSGKLELNLAPELTHELMRFCGGMLKKFSESSVLKLQQDIDHSIAEAKAQDTLG